MTKKIGLKGFGVIGLIAGWHIYCESSLSDTYILGLVLCSACIWGIVGVLTEYIDNKVAKGEKEVI